MLNLWKLIVPTKDLVSLLENIERKLEEITTDQADIDDDVRNARLQLREMLSNPEAVPEPDEYLLEQLADVAQKFEAEHPVLTEWVGKISDLFSRMGL